MLRAVLNVRVPHLRRPGSERGTWGPAGIGTRNRFRKTSQTKDLWMLADLVSVAGHAIDSLKVAFLLGGESSDVCDGCCNELLELCDLILVVDDRSCLLSKDVSDSDDLSVVHAEFDIFLRNNFIRRVALHSHQGKLHNCCRDDEQSSYA